MILKTSEHFLKRHAKHNREKNSVAKTCSLSVNNFNYPLPFLIRKNRTRVKETVSDREYEMRYEIREREIKAGKKLVFFFNSSGQKW